MFHVEHDAQNVSGLFESDRLTETNKAEENADRQREFPPRGPRLIICARYTYNSATE